MNTRPTALSSCRCPRQTLKRVGTVAKHRLGDLGACCFLVEYTNTRASSFWPRLMLFCAIAFQSPCGSSVSIQQGITSVFSQADIVVLPYIEASQSGVFVVALAAGVPTVATPVGGLKEQIETGVTGLLAETVTPENLAKAIANLISDTQLYERCSAGAIAAAANAYSTERAAEALLKASRTIRSLPPR